MAPIAAPNANLLLVSANSRKERRTIMNFAPKIGLTCINYGDLEQIDYFYYDCQNFRDYYRDSYNHLHRPDSFKGHFGKCGRHVVDKNSAQLMLPNKWHREKQPIVFPIFYEHELNLGKSMELGGTYAPYSCSAFKR